MKRILVFAVSCIAAVSAVLIAGLGGTPGGKGGQVAAGPLSEPFMAGRNVNMVSGKTLPWGDPWLQRQNEPSVAVSSRNPWHLFAGSNDYRTIDMPDFPTIVVPGIPVQIAAARDAWLGVFKSFDGGQSWITTLLPGYPQDDSPEATASPIHGYDTACDPSVQAGANGLFFMSGIAFNRNGRASAVFVSRWIDNNNLEKVRRDGYGRPDQDPIKYVDTKVVGAGVPGQFLDMPGIAVDIPRDASGTSLIEGQNIPNARVYLAYTVFPGVTAKNVRSKLYFARSTTSGRSWYAPIKVSEGQNLIQRAVIAIDPGDPTGNTIYIAYRRFAFDLIPDAIVVVKSTNGGATFSKPVEVAALSFPFDQSMAENRFRTNTYPAMAVDQSGVVSIAWAERRTRSGDPAADGQARIVVSSSADGLRWTPPAPVDPADPLGSEGLADGHQIMPAMTYAGGRLMLVWYDQRRTLAKETNADSVTPFIEDSPGTYRHTLDVRAAEGVPGMPPTFLPSRQVSRYLHYFELGSDGEPVVENGFYKLIQAEYNPVNFDLFQQGTRPFIGDFIDVASSPKVLPPPLTNGTAWRPNTDGAANPTSFHAVWTDNRDVRPPLPDWWGDWVTYYPPNSDQPAFDLGQTLPCQGDTAGKRNQNVYTASLTAGVEVGSPGNTKQLDKPGGTPGGRRTFAVFVRNLTEFGPRTFQLSFGSVAGGVPASFRQNGDQATRNVEVGPFSSASVTVYVDRSTTLNGLAPVKVDVREGGQLVGYVLLNPDRTNLPVIDPDGQANLGDEDHTPEVSDPKVWKYDLGSGEDPHPGAGNPRVQNPRVQNSGLVNPRVQNQSQENPRVQNKSLTNENIVNAETGNPRVQNPRVQNTALTDMTWTVTNQGNTTSCFSFDIAAQSWETLAPYFENGTLYGQLLIYRVHTTPLDSGCALVDEHHDELLVNVTNPRVQNPRVQNTDPTALAVQAADEEAPATEPDLTERDAAFWLAPGEQACVIFRVYDPTTLDNVDFEPQTVAAEVESQAVNTDGAAQIIVTQPDVPWWDPEVSLPEIGVTPSPVALGAVQGADPAPSYLTIWNAGGRTLAYTIQDDAVWLTVDPGSGTSTSQGDEKVHTLAVDVTGLAPGIYPARITVNDQYAANNPVVVPVELTVYGTPPGFSITTTSVQDGVRGTAYSAVLDCAGGLNPKSWSLASGSLPPGLSIENTEGGYALLIGTPTAAGYYTFTVQATDSLPQTATQSLSLTVADWVARYNGPANLIDRANDMVVDPAGNIYVAGYRQVSSTEAEYVTIKYSPSGSVLWMATYGQPGTFGGTAEAIAVDALGNVYVAGGCVDSASVYEYATIKYDSSGVQQWAARYRSPWANAAGRAYAIAVDASGNVYVTGDQTAIDQGTDFVTVKYNSAGVLQWAENYNGPGDMIDVPESIAVDPQGNVYVAGYSYGDVTSQDYAVVKYDGAGTEQWVARYAGPDGSGDYPRDLAVDSSGNVYVTGFSGSGNAVDYTTIKYNASGGQQWIAAYNGPGNGSDSAQAIAIDALGYVYVTGYSLGTGSTDFATAKYDPATGAEVWVARYDGAEGGTDGASEIACDEAGGVYVSGISGISAASSYDLVMVKYDSTGARQWTTRYDGPDHLMDTPKALAIDPLGNLAVSGIGTGSASGEDLLTIRYAQSFPSTLVISSAPLDNGYVGLPYAKALWAFGGSGNRTWFLAETAPLPPGLNLNSATGVIWGTPIDPGTSNFSVQVVDGELVASKDLSLTITTAQPDLVVEVSHTPESPTVSDPITITAAVRNIGTAAAGASALFLDGPGDLGLPRGYPISALPPGGTQTVSWSVVPIIDPSGYLVIALADSENEVAEADETNNRTEHNVTVIGFPDLIMESLSVNPPNPTTTDAVTITAVIGNQGTAPAGASTTPIGVTGFGELYYDVPALAPGASSGPITRAMTGLAAGSYAVIARADDNGTTGVIAESDETNNSREIDFTVTGGLDHFEFSAISSPQRADLPIPITITAKDALGNTVTAYAGTNALTAEAGTVSRYSVDIVPTSTGAFTNGAWSGTVTFYLPNTYSIQIHTSGGGRSGDSSQFDVLISSPQTSSGTFWRSDPLIGYIRGR